jgi:hypothetical protein
MKTVKEELNKDIENFKVKKESNTNSGNRKLLKSNKKCC